jgi:hypothetical protein
VGWEEKVDLADNESEVIQVARDYMAKLEPWEIAHLPVSCQPRKLMNANDVSEYAFDLMCYERDNELTGPLLQRLSCFYSRAAIRLSQLMQAKGNDDDAAEISASG